MPRPSRRDHVLQAASARFFRDGITATGVDRVIADAGVAKMTLYNNFGSKDELVVAYLEDRDRRFFERLDEEIAAGDAPYERAMTPVSLYRRYLDEDGFRGCAFVNAAAELPPDHPGRAVVARHKRRLLDRWTDLIRQLEVAEPEAVAHECFLLLEGAYVHAGLGNAQQLFDVVEDLIGRRLTQRGRAPTR